MNDLERIKELQQKLGIKLQKTSLENLFTENYFLKKIGFTLSYIQNPNFPFKGVRNYSLDENNNVTGLALDYCGLFVLENNYLQNFNKLKKLTLKNSFPKDYSFLSDLTELQELDLSFNNLSKADFLKDLRNLTSLYLRNNKLTNAEFLKDLRNLTSLALSLNQLTNAEFLKDLRNLTSLDLSSNKLTNAEFLKDLPNLTSLALSDNELTNAEFLKDLTNLTSLDLSWNQLTNAEFLKDLRNLTSLALSLNQLTNAEFLKDLPNLTSLDLKGNEFLEEIISKEVLEDYRNPQRIINHYFKVKDGKPINEAKIVVVGEADYGKTLLINRLVNGDYIKTETTHGIIITEWKDVEVNDEKVKLNIWDFGGQKIMQNTHQYFFTERTIYILVLNARQNEAGNKAREHLERIKSVSKDSPIIVLVNKIDETNGEFDIKRSELRENFNIKAFYGVCSDARQKKYDSEFEKFKSGLIEEIAKLEGIHKPFRKEWFKIKNHLEDLRREKRNYIKYHDYLSFCFKNEVEEELDQTEIVTFLNELGIIVYLQKEKGRIILRIDEKLIFNPEWLIGGVYEVINKPQLLKRRAILDFETFQHILAEGNFGEYSYQTDDYEYILKMMLACKLCVKMKNTENDYLIPDHLKEDKSKILKDFESVIDSWKFQLNFQFHYTELFDDIFRRFLIGLYDYVYEEYYWKTGVVLNYEDCKAVVTADNNSNKIFIKITGENARHRQNLLAIIYKEFNDIHRSFPNLSYSEWVAHKDYSHIIRSYKRLISMEKNGNKTEHCEEVEKDFPLSDFLDNVRFIEIEKEQEKMKSKYNFPNAGQVTIIEQAYDEFEINYQKITKEQTDNLDNRADELNKKLELILSNQTQASESYQQMLGEMQIMLNEVMSVIGGCFEQLDANEQRRYESLKHKEDWESTITFIIPVLDKLGLKIETKTKFENVKEKFKQLLRLSDKQ